MANYFKSLFLADQIPPTNNKERRISDNWLNPDMAASKKSNRKIARWNVLQSNLTSRFAQAHIHFGDKFQISPIDYLRANFRFQEFLIITIKSR